MVGLDRNGDNLLHASLAGGGINFPETAKDDGQAQCDIHTLLLRRLEMGVSLSESE